MELVGNGHRCGTAPDPATRAAARRPADRPADAGADVGHRWCKERQRKYPVVLPEYWDDAKNINPYCFMEALFKQLVKARLSPRVTVRLAWLRFRRLIFDAGSDYFTTRAVLRWATICLPRSGVHSPTGTKNCVHRR